MLSLNRIGGRVDTDGVARSRYFLVSTPFAESEIALASDWLRDQGIVHFRMPIPDKADSTVIYASVEDSEQDLLLRLRFA